MSATCPLRDDWRGRPGLVPLKEGAIHALIPRMRAFVRYGPSAEGRRRLWHDVVEPYFAWHAHGFTARTVFGNRISGTTWDVLQQSVYYFGVWKPNLTRWISERLGRGDVFVDVGANVGYFSLLGSTLVGPEGGVVAVEASPRTFDRLAANLARNGARNVRAVNVAAANAHGSAQLAEGPEENTGLATLVRDLLTVHADRGSSMRSKPVAFLLADLGVLKTHSRPYTSTDNPYSEAQFKTLKYRPGFPARFDSIEHARAFCRGFFPWYNDQHRHSGIGLMTPATVHHGLAEQTHAQRADVLDAAYAATPERFVQTVSPGLTA